MIQNKEQYKTLITTIILFAIVNCNVYGQTKIITGKVIGEDFEILNSAVIQTVDSVYSTRANDSGEFELKVPKNTTKIQAWFIGMETEQFQLKSRCHLNIILINDIIVEYETVKEARKDYQRRRSKADKLFKKAYDLGIFKEKKCK